MVASYARDSNIEQLGAMLSGLPDTVRVVSFDVFGTLIHRMLPHPEVSKTPAVRRLQAMIGGDPGMHTVSNLLAVRNEAERRLRNTAKSLGSDPECRIDEVFRAWLQHFGLEPDEGNLDSLITTEWEAERSVVYAARGMKGLVAGLRKQGLRTVFVSDMYLRQSMIEDLLDRCGYEGLFDTGFVSCEIHAAKYSGRLFNKLMKSEGIESSELVHVGDDDRSDIRGARKVSVQALRYTNPSVERRHREQACIESLRHKNPFWNGARWTNFAIAHPDHATRSSDDERYRIGYERLGPLVCNFIHRIILCARKQKLELLVFPSREGFLLREVFLRLADAVADSAKPPRSVYAHLTRKSVYAASLKQFSEREVRMGFRTARPTVRGLCTRFTLPFEEVEPCARRAGIEDPDRPINNPMQHDALQRLIRDQEFLEIVERTRQSRAALLHEYLGKLGFWDCQTVGFVDVGWQATMQEALEVAISDIQGRPSTMGFYMAVLGNGTTGSRVATSCEGLFYDHSASPGANFFSHFEEFFETCCRAPHPTVIDYERDTQGDVRPVFKAKDSLDYRLERKNEPLIASIQAGALDYCEDYVRSLPFHDGDPEILSDYILYKVDRLIRMPTRSEAEMLSRFYHCEDFGLSLIHVPDDANPPEMDVTGETATFPQHRIWLEGDRTRAGIPGLNALYNFYRAAKSKAY